MNAELDVNLIDALISLKSWCEKIARIAGEIDFDEFRSKEVLQLALSMAVSQVGEISGRIVRKWPQFAAENPAMQLSHAYAMRHRLIHVYEQIDLAILWDTVTNSIPEMSGAVGTILAANAESAS